MKKITIQKLKHATMLIECGGHRIAIDPGSMTSPASRIKLNGVDAVLVTHKHGDHFDAEVLREIGAPVFGPPEVAALARASGLAATPLELNKLVSIAGMKIIPAAANHGPTVTKPVENFGFVIEVDEVRLYVTGDMAGPQENLPVGPFKLVVLPVEGGGFVFDGKEAAEFLRGMGHIGLAVPVHADEAPAMHEEFVNAAKGFCKPVNLGVGETIEL